LENPDNTFLEEARIDDEDRVEEGALKVTGKTEEEFRDKSKQSQKELLEHFFNWFECTKLKNFICENPQFDWGFITVKAIKYSLKIPYHHRCFDLHSIASLKYFEINNRFLIKDNHSDMSLPNALKFCGIEDMRKKVEGNEVLKEGKPHNALEDCKLEAEAFSRLVYGKGLFPEYAEFLIPEHLKNKSGEK
jgi:DNA polymerase III epsilon subunit-like protein